MRNMIPCPENVVSWVLAERFGTKKLALCPMMHTKCKTKFVHRIFTIPETAMFVFFKHNSGNVLKTCHSNNKKSFCKLILFMRHCMFIL